MPSSVVDWLQDARGPSIRFGGRALSEFLEPTVRRDPRSRNVHAEIAKREQLQVRLGVDCTTTLAEQADRRADSLHLPEEAR